MILTCIRFRSIIIPDIQQSMIKYSIRGFSVIKVLLMSLRGIALGTVFGMLFVVAFLLMTGNASAATAPVTIEDDSGMSDYAFAHSLPGDGSYGDPYIIDGLVIDAHDANNGLVIRNVHLYVIVQNCVINNTHNINVNIGSGDGIFISSSSNITLSNNHVNETYNGITISSSQSIVVTGCTVHNVTYAGIKIADSSDVQVTDNFCADSSSGISSIQSTHGSKFDNNTCLRGTYGFHLAGSYQNILSDNNASGNVYGISIEAGSFSNQINLNNCSSNSNAGIFVMGDNNLIAGNQANFNLHSGIQVNTADNCIVKDNICIGNLNGINATGVNHVTLNNNNCSWSSSYGFYANYCQNITTNDNAMFFNTAAGIYLTSCKTSYLWNDVIGQGGQTGVWIGLSSWIYTTAQSSYNAANGFSIVNSDNCTLASANASHNANGVSFENCHLCRVIDSNIMANTGIGILTSDSDNSSILRVRAYLNHEGLTLSNSDHETVSDCHLLGNAIGIWLNDATWAQINNNEIKNGAESGMLLTGPSGSDNCNIMGNTISGYSMYGIQILSSEHTTLVSNTIMENDVGVRLNVVSNISITSNLFSTNTNGLVLQSSNDCTVSSNLFSGNLDTGIIAQTCSNGILETNVFHNGLKDIDLVSCTNFLIDGNQCDATQWGIRLLDCTGTTIRNGNCTDSTGSGGAFGIYVHGGAGNIIQNMNLTECSMGLLLETTDSGVVTSNTFYRNMDTGLTMYTCTNMLLHHNLFLFNHGSTSIYSDASNQAYDDNSGMNHWNTSGPDGIGNFWSDWCYPDLDRNGVVDDSLSIDGGGVDSFPIADTGAPEVTITSPGSDGIVFNTATVSFSWGATDDWSGIHHFELSMDNGTWNNIGIGNFYSYEDLMDGEHFFKVKAVDKAGNEKNASRSFYVDVNPPVVEITSPGNNTVINNGTPTIEWTGQDAGTGIVTYMVGWDSEPYTPVGTNDSFTFDTPLADGSHIFYLRASDGSDHIRVCFIEFYIDTALPTLDSISPSNGTSVVLKDVPFTWYAFDMASSPSGLDRTEIRLDAGAWVDKGLGSMHTFLNVTEGYHTIYLKTFDKAGNIVEKNVSIMVDYEVPMVSITSPSNHSLYSVTGVSITWTGSDQGSGIDHYEVGIDSDQMTSVGTATSWTANIMGDGNHKINVMAVDKSGKVRIAHIIIVVDTLAPMLSISTPTEGGFYFAPQVNITWTSMEYGSGVASYGVRVDGGSWQSRGTATYALLQMTEGAHTVYVRVTDLAGNSRTSDVGFTLDLNPPVIHSMSPSEGAVVNTTTVVFGWDVSDAIGITSIMYSIDSETEHGLMASATSQSVILSNGVHSFKLTVRDRDGREAVGYVNLTVDAVAPTIVAHSPANANAGVADLISFRFSEKVNVTGLSIKVNGVAASYVLNGTTYEVSKLLVAGTTYAVQVTGAKDLVGNVMDMYSWSFNVISGEQLPGQVVVGGTTVDKNGQPISGAAVTLGGMTTTTNGQGQFSMYVDPGQHELRITANGMNDLIQNVNVTSNQQLGEILMTEIPDDTGQAGTPSFGGDMTLLMVIGVLAATVAVVAVVVMRKRKG